MSQASFDPPGLTVAVKKDRAVENLLQVGNRFNLNVLKDGNDKARLHCVTEPQCQCTPSPLSVVMGR